jgi:nucleoside-diphosphate-sugar epimerase
MTISFLILSAYNSIMKILLTGAFGNIGVSTLKHLLNINKENNNVHEIVCLDLKNRKTQKVQEALSKQGGFSTIWGSVIEKDDLESAVKDVDSIIHLAAILAPTTEEKPELSFSVNVGGTKNIVDVALIQEKKPKLILASSISIYGPMNPRVNPTRASDPINPTDLYTRTKAEAEVIIKESGLSWLILRLTAVPPLGLSDSNEMGALFEIPLEQHIEFAHTMDVGLAFANAALRDVEGKILLIGGGKKDRMVNRDFISRFLEAVGIGMISEKAFRKPKNDDDWYYVNWIDTEESQRLLEYQWHSFDDFIEELRSSIGWKRFFIRLSSWFVRRNLEKKSPYING